MNTPPLHKKLTIDDVVGLGQALMEVAYWYPTRFLTERDFFPLVMAYLSGRIPYLNREVAATEGVVDFRIGGNNPTWLELAVQPRQLIDVNNKTLRFPGHSAVNSLYAGQNKTELGKLMKQPTGTTRFLLLLDLTGRYDLKALVAGYKQLGKSIGGRFPVRVIYVTIDPKRTIHFLVGC